MRDLMIKNPIQRLSQMMHFMTIHSIDNYVEVTVSGQTIASSTATKKIKEVGFEIYEPRLYFPREDVDFKFLNLSSKTTHCPLKGDTQYFDLIVADKVIKNAAWSYTTVLTFDERISEIKNYIAFDKELLLIIEYPLSNTFNNK